MKKILFTVLLAVGFGNAFAAQQTIDNSPGALTKIQQNFSELYVPIARTANEIAAGITPTAIGYPVGDLRRYGVSCPQLADATTPTAGNTSASANTTILNALGAAAWQSNVTFIWPAGICGISGHVTISDEHISHFVDARNKIYYFGTANQPAVTIGNSSGSSSTTTLIGGSGFHIENRTSHAYADEGFVGLEFLGSVQNTKIVLRKISGFSVCAQVHPNTTGFAYNLIELPVFLDCGVGLDLHSFLASQFINENIWIGGNWHITALADTLPSYAIRFKAETGAYAGHNRNLFIKPNFEFTDGNVGVARTPVLFDNAGVRNRIEYGRVEGGRGYIADVVASANAVNNNEVEITVLSGTWTGYLREPEGSLAYANSFTNLADGLVSQKPIWFSGDLARKAIGYTSSTISVKGMFIQNQSGSPSISGTGRVTRDYVVITGANAIGVDVDTSFYKQFLIRSDIRSGFGGRFKFVCKDASGAALGASDGPYVVASGLSGGATYGYSYSTGTDSTSGLQYVSVAPSCVTTSFLRSSGTVPLHIRSMEIWALSAESNPKPLRVTTGLANSDNEFYSNGDPATNLNGGWLAKGTRITNVNAASGVTPGYIVSAEGFFAPAWAATTSYTVGYTTNNDTGKTYMVTAPTSGTCTSAGSGGPTGTGSGITDNTCTWAYIGTQATTIPLPVLGMGDTTYVRLAADITSGLDDSYKDITGLGYSVAPNITVEFECAVNPDADATTTGIDVAMNGPSSPTSLNYSQLGWTSTSAIQEKLATTYDANTALSGSQGTASRTFRLKGVVANGVNAGTLIPRIKRESVGTGPNVRAGSYCVYRRISSIWPVLLVGGIRRRRRDPIRQHRSAA